MKNIVSFLIIFYLTIIDAALAGQSINTLKSKIIEKGAIPLIKTEVDNDTTYEDLLETQYKFILDEEIKIIKDIKVAENSCKIMGINDSKFKKKKKKFAQCVLEVWQARLIGKKFATMQSEINTQDFDAEELQKYFNKELRSFNEIRKKQMKKNINFKEKFKKLGVKEKLEKIDYEKIVLYAIGIVAVYYIGKTIGDSLADAKIANEASSSAKSTVRVLKPKNQTLCNYGRMLYVRYRIRHGTLIYCNLQ